MVPLLMLAVAMAELQAGSMLPIFPTTREVILGRVAVGILLPTDVINYQ